MPSEQFKVGDVVQLKSGGPLMTIVADEGSGNFFCRWFNGGQIDQSAFPSTALRKEAESKKPQVQYFDNE
jgi:uncharacterized protein YodC (DUF2158 family)